LPQTIDFGSLLRKGLRADLGLWLNPQQSLGLELGGFWVDDRAPGSQGQAGTLGVASQFHSELWGAEAILRAEVYRGTWAHLDVLAGFRYLSLDEALAIEEHDIAANVSTWDRCGTGNCFYGGQLGAETVLHYSRWFLDLWGKAALGVNDQTIDVNGTTVAGGQAFPGGNLASPALLGRHRRDEFAVVPEAGVRLGCELAQHVRVTAGYTFLYLTNAARPGVQIDALLSAPRPSPFPFQSGEFWVQGLNLGVEFRF